MTHLIESLQIITRFAHEIGNRANLIIDFDFPKKGFTQYDDKQLTLLNSLFYMSIIDAYSYLAEYEEVFGVKTESEFRIRIIEVKTINKPFLNKLKEWSQLGDMRNQLLAHNLRKGKNGQFIFGIDNITFIAPRTINDLFLLSNLIQFITQTIHLEFTNEFKNHNSHDTKDVLLQNNPLSKDEVSTVSLKLLLVSQAEMVRLNKTYRHSINVTTDWNKL